MLGFLLLARVGGRIRLLQEEKSLQNNTPRFRFHPARCGHTPRDSRAHALNLEWTLLGKE